jgi:hypothetical protein
VYETRLLGTEKKGIETASYYKEMQNSFKILYNPLYQHYLPLFLKYGPRSRIFESLSNGDFSIDIRNQIPPGVGDGNGFFIPFFSLIPLVIILFIIWYKEITKLAKCQLKRKFLFI